jgi:preprotein translocase YajC subunit
MLMLWADLGTDPSPMSTPPPFWSFGGPGFMLVMMGITLFFLFVLPARRQRKEHELMLARIKPGAKVYLNSGIIGHVVSVKDGDEDITIRSADAKLRVLRNSVTRVVADGASDSK